MSQLSRILAAATLSATLVTPALAQTNDDHLPDLAETEQPEPTPHKILSRAERFKALTEGESDAEAAAPLNERYPPLARELLGELPIPETDESIQCRQTRLSEAQREELGLTDVCALTID